MSSATPVQRGRVAAGKTGQGAITHRFAGACATRDGADGLASPAVYERFLALHSERSPLLMPNAWDTGSAKLLASLGFEALATTSSGFAATLGRLDGSVTRDEALAHAAALASAVAVPVMQRETLAELFRLAGLVRRAGVNLNQAVTRLNATGEAGPDLEPSAAYCMRTVRRVDEAAQLIIRRGLR